MHLVELLLADRAELDGEVYKAVAPLRGLSWVIGGPGFLREPSIRDISGFSRGRRTNYNLSETDKVRARSLEKIPSFICTSQTILKVAFWNIFRITTNFRTSVWSRGGPTGRPAGGNVDVMVGNIERGGAGGGSPPLWCLLGT